jgi:hypothetical protein
VRPFSASLLLLLALIASCVPRSERRETNTEAASGPPAAPRDEHTAGEVVAGSPRMESAPELGPRPGADWVRVRGAWRWDGVRYVWVAPHWEKRDASFARPYPGER